jgi:hypothetical protein
VSACRKPHCALFSVVCSLLRPVRQAQCKLFVHVLFVISNFVGHAHLF